jgi:hypothetical protein
MTNAAPDIRFSSLTHLKAALISTEKATQFTNSVQILLLERLAIHRKHPLKAAGGLGRDGQAARSARWRRQFQGNSAARSLIL